MKMAVSDDAIYAAATALTIAILREDCEGEPDLRKTMLSNYVTALHGNLYTQLQGDMATRQKFTGS
jgi:hypothetical protein